MSKITNKPSIIRKPVKGKYLQTENTKEVEVKKLKSVPSTTKTDRPVIKSNNDKLQNKSPKISTNINKTNTIKQSKPTIQNKTNVTKMVTKIDSINKPTTRTTSIPMRANVAIPIDKNTGIMTKIHNVTVSTPPSQRKDILTTNIMSSGFRERTRTRTLEPHEVLVLKTNLEGSSNKPNITSSVPMSPNDSVNNSLDISQDSIEISEKNFESVKSPIKFEINFEKPSTSKFIEKKEKTIETTSTESDYEYDDDFETYESDFESEVSSKHSSNEDEEKSISTSASLSSSSEDLNKKIDVQRETIIQTDIKVISDERKLDSGNYEIDCSSKCNSGVGRANHEIQTDSIDEGTDENYTNDSGLGYFQSIKKTPKPLTVNQIRGKDLMNKIQLDEMHFMLFELKPMPYEYFMKVYGNINTIQSSSQTNDCLIEQDVQTDRHSLKTVWTQYPPQFSKEGLLKINSKYYYSDKNGYGEDDNDDKDISKFSNKFNLLNSHIAPNNYDRLNLLLQRASITISDLTYKKSLQSNNSKLMKTCLKISNGYSELSYRNLNNSKIVDIYTNLNYIITINKLDHQSQSTHNTTNLIYIWNVFDLKNPFKILSSWSKVACFLNLNEHIIICGLSDGSIAIWDIRELSHWHTDLNGEIIRIPSQIIVPDIFTNKHKIEDFGRVVDLKGIKSYQTNSFLSGLPNSVQICSLHEIGVLTMWTYLESKLTNIEYNNPINKCTSSQSFANNISPWSKVRLIQSSLLDLRSVFIIESNPGSFKSQTKFQKHRTYFENDIFNDNILKELHKSDDQLNISKKLEFNKNVIKFQNVETTQFGYFITLNKNYLIYLKKSLKINDVKKVIIVDDALITLVTVTLFSDEKYLAIGLSDGCIKIISCDFNESLKENNEKSFDYGSSNIKATEPLSSSPSTSMTIQSKSCAIQNLVKDERKLYDTQQALNNLDYQELIKQQQNSYNPNLNTNLIIEKFNLIVDKKFLLLNNFQKVYIKKIKVFQNNENLLLALVGKKLKFFNLDKNLEINLFTESNNKDLENIKNFDLVENYNKKIYLILLLEKIDSCDNVQIHELNENINENKF